MFEQLYWPDGQPFTFSILLINFGIGTILSMLMRWHFEWFGSTYSNREAFSRVFPFLVLTTILVISVVKSSIALSLGLVGALSIVRFRTPIKEPEELAYLFIAIAIGIGLGAGQILATLLFTPWVLALATLMNRSSSSARTKGIFMTIDLKEYETDDEPHLERIKELIGVHVPSFDLRRLDARENAIEIIFFLPMTSLDKLSVLLRELQQQFPTIGVTYLDQEQLSIL